jgi:hypothetical protein
MYVILTSKPGQFRTEITEGLNPLEAYDYLFYGQKKAHFVIAELVKDDTRIRVVEEVSEIVNNVPCKFLEKFDSRERAFRELEHLTTFGHMETSLRKTATASAA